MNRNKARAGSYGEFIDGCLPLFLLVDLILIPASIILAVFTIPCWLPLYGIFYAYLKLSGWKVEDYSEIK